MSVKRCNTCWTQARRTPGPTPARSCIPVFRVVINVFTVFRTQQLGLAIGSTGMQRIAKCRLVFQRGLGRRCPIRYSNLHWPPSCIPLYSQYVPCVYLRICKKVVLVESCKATANPRRSFQNWQARRSCTISFRLNFVEGQGLTRWRYILSNRRSPVHKKRARRSSSMD